MADPRWIAAGVASVVAVGVVAAANFRPQPPATPSVVSDARGDVVGTAAASLEDALDLTGATLTKAHDTYRLEVHLRRPLDWAAIGREPVWVEVRLRSGAEVYALRVDLSANQAAAYIVDSQNRKRPFVLDPPQVTGARVVVEVPDRAVRRLADQFSWGVTTNGGGSQDRAPSNLSALFPGAAESGDDR